MIRILLFILGVIAAAAGLAWLADRPGTVTVEWLGYQVETSALVGALAVAGVVVLLILIWAVLRYLFTRPAAVAAYVRERRRQQGYDALSRGLLAIGVGDRTLAQRYAGIAGRNLPREPLTALLRAQAAQLKGDREAARRAFEAMLDSPETQLLGLRGLFLEASRSNDNEAARALAEQAVRRDPKLAWGVNALFDMQARAADYEGALNTLAIARQNGHVDQNAALRRRAVLLTAEARAAEASDPEKALGLAGEALRLAPSLVPAAEIAGRILASKGESRQASRVISRTWKLSPHPDLALVYAYAKPGEPPRERVKRVKYLASLTPGDIEGPIAVANAAIEASGRRVVWLHMPTLDRTDEAFYAPLRELRPQGARVYLGMIHSMASFDARLAVARRFLPDFGVAAYCGFGRLDPAELPVILRDHLHAVKALAA